VWHGSGRVAVGEKWQWQWMTSGSVAAVAGWQWVTKWQWHECCSVWHGSGMGVAVCGTAVAWVWQCVAMGSWSARVASKHNVARHMAVAVAVIDSATGSGSIDTVTWQWQLDTVTWQWQH
jgi:hypothetical protein